MTQHPRRRLFLRTLAVCLCLSPLAADWPDVQAEETVEVPIPGELAVQPRADASGERLAADYGLRIARRIPRPGGPDTLILTVPQGQEPAWQQVLARHPAVAEVARRTVRLPLDKYQQENRRIASPRLSAIAAADPARIDTAVRTFFDEAAKAADARLEEEGRGPLWTRLVLTGMRGQIVEQRRWWESLTLTLVLIPTAGDPELMLIADGRYAPGLGDRPPAGADYLPLGADYADALQGYVQRLATALQRALEAVRP